MGDQRDWSNGIASDFAPADGARSSVGADLVKCKSARWSLYHADSTHSFALRSLISSSHASTSHHGMTATHFASSVGTMSSHFVTSFMRS